MEFMGSADSGKNVLQVEDFILEFGKFGYEGIYIISYDKLLKF